MGRGIRMTRLTDMMLGYLRKEAELLKSADESHNVSSDIIESAFGYFKERKATNRMYGVTSFVMVLPLHAKLSTLEAARDFDFREALERTHTSDVKAWEKENLPENLSAKRTRILRTAC